MFIDTHCHLNILATNLVQEPLREPHWKVLEQAINAADAAGVKKIINVGTAIDESKQSMEIARRYASVFSSIGVHPTDCNELPDSPHEVQVALKNMLHDREHSKIVGIGETGLDFYHKPFNQQRQVDYFKMHLELALEHKLPVVVHVREAADETLRVLEEFIPNGLRAVIHCFQQELYVAKQACSWGLYVGIDAPIGYPKNGWMREVVKQIPLEHMVLETDAPFLPPQEFRGKMNYPAYIPLIAQELATLLGVAPDVVEERTTRNACTLFGI